MRYYIGFLITIGLVIVLILLLFAGGGSKSKTAAPMKKLNSYATTDAQVSITVDGPIVADSLHQSYRIIISNSDATFEAFQGYNDTLINIRSYPNNVNAYYAFLSSLTIAGFTSGDKSPTVANDTGLCPQGNRTDYRMTQDGQSLLHYWSTTCGSATYTGSISLTMWLFHNQIPNYGQLTSNLNV